MKFYLDEYAHLNSILHRWHPAYKIIGLIILIFAFASVRNIVLIPLILIITGILYLTAKLPISFLINRLQYPSLIILGIVGLLPFFSGTNIIWQYSIISIKLEGLQALLLITTRFIAIITITLILFGTTPFFTIIKTFRNWGLSPIIGDMILLTYRYLFTIFDQLAILEKSAQLRGFNFRKFTKKNLEVYANLIGNLLIRSYEQSHRIYQAMQLRGYDQVRIINNMIDNSESDADNYKINNYKINHEFIQKYLNLDSILLIIIILISLLIITLEIIL
jgi:cobalt/nickel transport system permease protein